MKWIGIIGTRRRNTKKDFYKVEEVFWENYEDGDGIVSGGCPKGGDAFAHYLHKKHSIPYLEFPADWKHHGKAAGFIRNTDIAGNSDILIACVSLDRTGGTEDTIRKFLKSNESERLILV